MARRRRVRVAPVQIPQFANVDQISGTNLRSYIESTAGTPMEGIARSALQIPGGRMLDDELADIEATLNDPSKRERLPSPYAGRMKALQSEARQVRDSVATGIRQHLQSAYNDLLEQERRTSGDFAKNSIRNQANEVMALINRTPAFDGDPSASDVNALSGFLRGNESNFGLRSASYQTQMSRLQSLFPELDSIRQAEQQFQTTANAGVTKPMTSAQRAALEQRRTRLGSEAATRLQQAARQFNQEQAAGAVAAGSTRQVPQRPLTGRFGIPQTGVGISIGGFR